MTTEENDSKNQQSDSVGNEAELIGRIIQSEQKLTDYFTTIITKSVTEQIERRNLARLRMVGIVSVVVVSFMIPAITLWVRSTIVSQTEVAINDQFTDAIERMEGRFNAETTRLEQNFESFLNSERTYLTFANYTLYLADRSNVPARELKNVLAILEQIENNPELISRPDFPFLVDLVARTAIKHGYADILTILEERLEEVLASSPRTMPRLARHYGESVVGDRFTSSRKLQTAVEKFQRYLDLSQGGPDFEKLLPLQLMVEKKLGEKGARERIESIQLYVLDLAPAQRASFIAETVRYSNPDFRDVPLTGRNRRIAGTLGRMTVDEAHFYAEMLADKSVQAALAQLANHEANLENTGIATALTGFRRLFVTGADSGENPKLQSTVRKLVSAEINPWLENPVIIEALRSQNRKTKDYSREQIEALENQWQDEFFSVQYDLIAEVLDRPVSRYLRRVKFNSLETYHEILLMDGIGLLAGVSDANDDYWQGEEPKWLETYQGGKDALHIRNLKFDESALAWEIQVSLPVVDSETDEPIGAITIGLAPSALVDSRL